MSESQFETTSIQIALGVCEANNRAFKTTFKTSQASEKAKMAKTNSEKLLRGEYLLLQKCSTKLENLALPDHLKLSLFVPLPLPAPGSVPELCK